MKESSPSPRPCPLCGSPYSKANMFEVFTQHSEGGAVTYTVAECQTCGLIQQNPAWSKQFYDALYPSHIYDPSGHTFYPSQVKRYREVADIIGSLPCTKPGAQFLDFGCYDGSFIAWTKDNAAWAKQIQWTGYDISLKGVPQDGSFFDSLDILRATKKRFDCVTLNHVVEHLLDPVQVLEFIREHLLAPEGYIVIEVPDISFTNDADFSPFFLQHTNYFTPHTMLALLATAGFGIERVRSFDNFILERDPHFQSLVAVGRISSSYTANGRVVRETVAKRAARAKARIQSLGKAPIAVVGCGDVLRSSLPLLEGANIVGFFDNNKNLWGTRINGIEVKPVTELASLSPDYVLVTVLHKHNVDQLVAQLTKLVDRKKILTFFD